MKRELHHSDKPISGRHPFRSLVLEQFESRVALDASGMVTQVDCSVHADDAAPSASFASSSTTRSRPDIGSVVEDSKPEGEWTSHADMRPNGGRPDGGRPDLAKPEGEGPDGGRGAHPSGPTDGTNAHPHPVTSPNGEAGFPSHVGMPGTVATLPPASNHLANSDGIASADAPHTLPVSVSEVPVSKLEPTSRGETVLESNSRSASSSPLPAITLSSSRESVLGMASYTAAMTRTTSKLDMNGPIAASGLGVTVTRMDVTRMDVGSDLVPSVTENSVRDSSTESGLTIDSIKSSERQRVARTNAMIERSRHIALAGWTQVGGVNLAMEHAWSGVNQSADLVGTHPASALVGTYQLFAIGTNDEANSGEASQAMVAMGSEDGSTWDSRAWLNDFLGVDEQLESTAGSLGSKIFLSSGAVVGGVVWLISQHASRQETKRGAVTGHRVTTPLRSI